MKKMMWMKSTVISLTVLFLLSASAHAKTGGPIECVGKGKFALSLETEYVQEQKMKDYKTYVNLGDGMTIYRGTSDVYNNDINFKIERYYLKVQYGIFDNLSIFLKSGIQRQKINLFFEDRMNSLMNEFIEIDDYNPLLAGGLKMKLCSMGDLVDIGFSGSYLWSAGKRKRETVVRIDNGTEYITDITHSEVEYHSWDVSLYFYKNFKFITPYIGAKYQNIMYSENLWIWLSNLGLREYLEEKYNQDMPWIMFWGCDFHINKRLDANIELSTFGSRSASFGLTWKF